MIITVFTPGEGGGEVGLGLWKLSDANGDNEFIFNIGPATGGAHQESKNVLYENTLGADSTVRDVVFVGADLMPTVEISGTVLNLSQLGFLEFFSNRQVPLTLTDDLGRVVNVYPTGFESQREHEVSHPQRHKYTMKFMILDGLLDDDFWDAFT